MKFRNNLENLPAYDVVEKPWQIKINANECSFNLPPLVAERVLSRLSTVAFNRYPNEQYDSLREQIAKNFNISMNQIIIGSGSSEIIEKIFYCFGGDSTQKILYPVPSFSMYKIYSKAAVCTSIEFKLDEDFSLDVEKFIDTVKKEQPNLAVICNPNNPTGNGLPLSKIETIVKNVDCPLLIDEAYIEFYGETAVNLIKQYSNLMIARTFSKAYGLAAARVGYLIADEKITSVINKSFMPYHMNVLSLVTADIVYQMRDEFVPRIQMTIAERKRMSELLKKLSDFEIFPSVTNFILLRHEKIDELNQIFEDRSIGVRNFGNATELKNCMRISIGSREENDIWYNIIKTFSQEHQQKSLK